MLFAVDTEKTAALDRPLGAPLADEHHDDGPVHLAGELAEDPDCRAVEINQTGHCPPEEDDRGP